MAPPVNDNFANRIALVGSSGFVTVDTTDATAEVGEPVLTGGALNTAWYGWTCPDPAPETITFSMTGSAVAGYFGVFRGTAVNLLVYNGDGIYEAGAIDTQVVRTPTGAAPATHSEPLLPGTEYKIQVSHYYPSQPGVVRLNWAVAATPPEITAVRRPHRTAFGKGRP